MTHNEIINQLELILEDLYEQKEFHRQYAEKQRQKKEASGKQPGSNEGKKVTKR